MLDSTHHKKKVMVSEDRHSRLKALLAFVGASVPAKVMTIK